MRSDLAMVLEGAHSSSNEPIGCSRTLITRPRSDIMFCFPLF
jgi:hypothetical protein